MYFNPLCNPYLCTCGTPYFAQSGGLVLSARQLFSQHAIHILRFLNCKFWIRLNSSFTRQVRPPTAFGPWDPYPTKDFGTETNFQPWLAYFGAFSFQDCKDVSVILAGVLFISLVAWNLRRTRTSLVTRFLLNLVGSPQVFSSSTWWCHVVPFSHGFSQAVRLLHSLLVWPPVRYEICYPKVPVKYFCVANVGSPLHNPLLFHKVVWFYFLLCPWFWFNGQ